MRVALPAVLFACCLALSAGCAGLDDRPASGMTAEEKLSAVGLRMVSEDEAAVPAGERGRYVAVRVIPGFPDPALAPDPAGYLIVGAAGSPAADAAAIIRALDGWEPDGELLVTVRRNPFLPGSTGWWEAEVKLRYPPARSSSRAKPPVRGR